MTRRWNLYIGLALLTVVWVGLVLKRYKSGENYQPIHVRLSSSNSEIQNFHVGIRSTRNSRADLIPSERDPALWNNSDSISAVKEVLVTVSDSIHISDFVVSVRVGQNWVVPSTELSSSSDPIVVEGDTNSDSQTIAYSFVPLSQSRIPSASGAINWSGDIWLILIPLLQTIAIAASIGGCLGCLSAVRKSRQLFNRQDSKIRLSVRCGLATGWFTVFLLLLLQLRQFGGFLWEFRFVEQFLAWFCVTVAITIITYCYFQLVRTLRSDWFLLVATIMVILLAKFGWIASVDTHQVRDFRIYWEAGKRMAAGEWGFLMNPQDSMTSLVAQRALMFTYPIAKWIGISQTSLEVSNVLIQIVTTIMCYVFVARMFNSKVALCSVPFLFLNPELWFATTTASHETPSILWIVLIFLAVDAFRVQIRKVEFEFRSLAVVLLIGCGLGILIAFLDLQRSFGPFALFALTVYLPVLVLTSRPQTAWRKNIAFVSVFLCITTTSYTCVKHQANTWLAAKTGPVGSASTLGYLAGIDTNTNASFFHIAPWCRVYYPNVPDSERSELAFRKLLHEKIEAGSGYWKHLFWKNEVIAGVGGMVHQAFGAGEGEEEPDYGAVPWAYTKSQLSTTGQVILLVLLLIRLGFIGKLPVRGGELYPAIFSFSTYMIILALTESNSFYDIFLALPLAWNAGLVVSAVLGLHNVANITDTTMPRRSMLSFASMGVVGLLVVVTIHGLAAFAIDGSNLTFANFHQLSPADSSSRSTKPKVFVSRECISLSFDSTEQQFFEKGDVVAAMFATEYPFSEKGKIEFFVTGNQRRRFVFTPDRDWAHLPVEFCVSIDGVELLRDRIYRLSEPVFVSHPIDQVGAQSVITVTLTSLSSWSPKDFEHEPVVAIEYVH
jgi:hypothetical protein